MFDRSGFAMVQQFAQAALLGQRAHVHVRFGADEVVDGHGYRLIGGRRGGGLSLGAAE
ncbi:hypothetical protein D3C76_1552730 [compost metagenome]